MGCILVLKAAEWKSVSGLDAGHTHHQRTITEGNACDSDTPKVIPNGTVSLMGWIKGPAKLVSWRQRLSDSPYKRQVVHLR